MGKLDGRKITGEDAHDNIYALLQELGDSAPGLMAQTLVYLFSFTQTMYSTQRQSNFKPSVETDEFSLRYNEM